MVGFWPSQRSSSPGLLACSRSRCSPCTGPVWGPPLEGRSPHLLGPRQQVCTGGSSSRPDSRAAEAWAESRTRSMELGDGDPEGWPRKGGELFSKQEKSLLPTPHLTPHPEGPGVRAALTPVCPLCGCSVPFPHPALCLFPFFETAIRTLQCSQRRGIYNAISHALSPLILPLHAYGEVGRAGITSISQVEKPRPREVKQG